MNNRPVVVGLGTIQQKGDFNQLDEALILMDKAFKKAIIDCTNSNIKEYIDEVSLSRALKEKEVKILVDLAEGKQEFTAWTSDLTEEYVKINADYRS